MTIEEQIRQRRMEIQNAVTDNILKGFESDIEKARHGTYADNAENRRLMRVGQKYGESSNTFKPGAKVRATLPTGKIIDAVYVEPYGRDRHSVKDDDGRLYGVTTDKIEKVTIQSKKDVARIGNLKEQINTLNRERKRLELDMEDELGQLSEEERNDGNNKLVVYYGRELSKVDNKLQKLNSELIKITKAQETEASVTDLIKAGVLEYDDSIEKAVYADTPQNRKLGRVGQEYHRGNGKKKSSNKDVKISYSKVLSLMDNNTKFSGEIESLIDKYLGEKLKKKFGSTDMADIYDAVGEDKFDSFMESMVKKLPSDKLQEVYKKYVK